MNTPPPLPNEANWYYANAKNEPQGPFTLNELRRLKKEGSITQNTLVIKEGNSEWEPYPLAVAFIEEASQPRKSNNPQSSIQGKMSEYRRTCRVCGKVWHSLVEREKTINRDIRNNSCHYCLCNPEVDVQADRNAAASKSEISRLKTCPDCHSANYNEEIVTHGV